MYLEAVSSQGTILLSLPRIEVHCTGCFARTAIENRSRTLCGPLWGPEDVFRVAIATSEELILQKQNQ